MYGCGYFGGVGVAAVDDGHGEGVGGEEEDYAVTEGGVVGGEGGFDMTSDGLCGLQFV